MIIPEEQLDDEIERNLNISAADAFLAGLKLYELVDMLDDLDSIRQGLDDVRNRADELQQRVDELIDVA